MKKRININEIIILFLVFLYSILFNIIYNKTSGFIFNYFNYFIWLTIAIICYFTIGYKKNYNRKNKISIQIIIIGVITYFLIIYLLGIITGFLKSPYNIDLLSIIKNLSKFTLYIGCREFIRMTLVRDKSNNKIFFILCVLTFTLFDILVGYRGYNLHNLYEIFTFIGVTILGGLFKNIMLSYVEMKSGYMSGLIYCLIMEGYLYIIPISPDLGVYLETIGLIVLPSILMISINKLYSEKENKRKKESFIGKIVSIQLVMVLIIFISLISGIFKYKIMAIASNSMNPIFYRGDAVIIDKIDENTNIKIGDIIAFNHDGIVVVHRVYKISKRSNNYYYSTKGDNNSAIDDFETSRNDVIGIEKAIIPYFGYPTVWLSELMK